MVLPLKTKQKHPSTSTHEPPPIWCNPTISIVRVFALLLLDVFLLDAYQVGHEVAGPEDERDRTDDGQRRQDVLLAQVVRHVLERHQELVQDAHHQALGVLVQEVLKGRREMDEVVY